MLDKVILSIGGDEIEIGTVGEVINLLGPAYHEFNKQSRVAYRIATFIAAAVDELTHDPDADYSHVEIEVR